MTPSLPTAQRLPVPPFSRERVAELPERRPGSLKHLGKTDWDRRMDMVESDETPTPETLK